MAKRSIKASIQGISKAKQMFDRKGWTQEYLAAEVGLSTRQSIWKFFTGKPIERHLFIDICFKLDLDWWEIVEITPEQEAELLMDKHKNWDLERLVQSARQGLYGYVNFLCSIVTSSVDSGKPLAVEDIFTHLNIIPHLSSQRWLEASELQDSLEGHHKVSISRAPSGSIPAMDIVKQHNRLIIFGKPGAGKTTFLQYLGLLCTKGNYKGDCVPFFILIKNIAQDLLTDDFSFVKYILGKVTEPSISEEQLKMILRQGKMLILLDGLDEIPRDSLIFFISKINIFLTEYSNNQIIISSRFAAIDYSFSGFYPVEIANFNQYQIETFVKKWFAATIEDPQQAQNKTQDFIKQISLKENTSIRELVVTPILLSLICSVFKERNTFPKDHAKLYQTGLDILLEKWDRSRGIHRDKIYQQLSLSDKINLLLDIAAINFEQGKYFFEKRSLIHLIDNYLKDLPEFADKIETLSQYSESVLKAIELQHGLLVEQAKDVYSFSHLTFQEYLTARKIVNLCRINSERELFQLASHTLEDSWQEVILLTVNMLSNPEYLLRKIAENITKLLEQENKLQGFIESIKIKADSLRHLHYKPVAIRAFYFTMFKNRDISLALALDGSMGSNLAPEISLDLALARAFSISKNLWKSPELKNILSLSFALELERTFNLDGSLREAIARLKHPLPNPADGKQNLQNWWRENGRNWSEEFRRLLVEHRQMGQEWEFTKQEQNLCQQYYSTNLLLVESLGRNSNISENFRNEIENHMIWC